MLAKILTCLYLCSCAASAELLVRDVTIVDVSAGAAHPNRSILIRGDRIAAVGGSGLAAPKGAQIVEGAGRFVIPGMWDMHVHLTKRELLPLYLARGVTGVRDMGGDPEHVKEWRDQTEKGTLTGPHIETCGPPIDGFPSEDPNLPVRVVRSPSEARSVYDHLDENNVNFIAVQSRLPRDAYFALIERARKYYSPVAGAVPATVTAVEAIDNRQRSIDEMPEILLACSTEEKKLRGPRALALERHDWAEFQDLETKVLATFSAEKADELFHRMATFDTRAVPMLLKLRSSPVTKDAYDTLAQLLLRMESDGVGIMAGTDDGLGGTRAHIQLQDELQLLVSAGLTPAQALRSVTIEPAKYLEASESLGAIAVGKIADLVLLDGNPLADIRNTRRVTSVILGGKYLPRARLYALTQRN